MNSLTQTVYIRPWIYWWWLDPDDVNWYVESGHTANCSVVFQNDTEHPFKIEEDVKDEPTPLNHGTVGPNGGTLSITVNCDKDEVQFHVIRLTYPQGPGQRSVRVKLYRP